MRKVFLERRGLDHEQAFEDHGADHEHANTCLELDPEGSPDLIMGSINPSSDATDHSNGDHEHAEAQHNANTDLLANP